MVLAQMIAGVIRAWQTDRKTIIAITNAKGKLVYAADNKLPVTVCADA